MSTSFNKISIKQPRETCCNVCNFVHLTLKLYVHYLVKFASLISSVYNNMTVFEMSKQVLRYPNHFLHRWKDLHCCFCHTHATWSRKHVTTDIRLCTCPTFSHSIIVLMAVSNWPRAGGFREMWYKNWWCLLLRQTADEVVASSTQSIADEVYHSKSLA